MTLDALFEKTKVHVKRVMGESFVIDSLTLEKSFDELGIDSLYLTEIAFALLTELDLYVPMAKVARTKSVKEFLELVISERA